MSMRRRWLVLLCALVVVAAACGDDDSTSTQPDDSSTTGPVPSSSSTSAATATTVPGQPWNRTFVSTMVTRELVDGTRIQLQFREGEVQAHAGCNHLSGQATIEGEVLVVSSMGGTEMGCDPTLHAQDEWLMRFLQGQPSWTLDGDSLTLFDGTDRIAMVDQETAEPDRSIEDVLWVVTSLVDGDTVSSIAGAPQVEASMTFTGGQVQGNDGCNSIGGPAAIGADSIEFGPLRSTKMACEQNRMTLADAVSTVLQGTVRYEIDADQLRLTTDSGRGLVLRARD